MAALNGHVFYAWWMIWSDVFNLTKYQIESMPIPDMWIDDTKMNTEAQNIGKQLEELLGDPKNITSQVSGTKGRIVENIDYHSSAPELIEQADRLYLKALNIDDKEANLMLNELHKLRSNSNWQ